ncbi:MAG TPA: hypothetical protein VF373_05985 [Prolixibacteraceae bacterium]
MHCTVQEVDSDVILKYAYFCKLTNDPEYNFVGYIGWHLMFYYTTKGL